MANLIIEITDEEQEKKMMEEWDNIVESQKWNGENAKFEDDTQDENFFYWKGSYYSKKFEITYDKKNKTVKSKIIKGFSNQVKILRKKQKN